MQVPCPKPYSWSRAVLPAGDKMQGWPWASCALQGVTSLWGPNMVNREPLLHIHQLDNKLYNSMVWNPSFRQLSGEKLFLMALTSPHRAWPCLSHIGGSLLPQETAADTPFTASHTTERSPCQSSLHSLTEPLSLPASTSFLPPLLN